MMVINKVLDGYILEGIADFICGDNRDEAPVYRSGSELSRFFARTGLPRFIHDGSTRKWWTLDSLKQCMPAEIESVILRLASPKEYSGNANHTRMAIAYLNRLLILEGLHLKLTGINPTLRAVEPGLPEDESKEPELQPLPPPNFNELSLEPGIGELLALRWDEAQRCIDAKAFLSATILMGSLLEGLLLAVMQNNPKEINQAKCAPRNPDTGKVKLFWDWKLTEMIDAAHAVGWIDLDVKKFSHSLREFRNMIHPYEQLATQCFPDDDTCNISWLVVQAACNDLAKTLKK